MENLSIDVGNSSCLVEKHVSRFVKVTQSSITMHGICFRNHVDKIISVGSQAMSRGNWSIFTPYMHGPDGAPPPSKKGC